MKLKVWLNLSVLLLVAGLIVWQVKDHPPELSGGANGRDDKERPVPVEVAAIEVGTIELRRSFSGTLQAYTEFVVSPKVSGRIEEINVDLADIVTRGQMVAQLDNDEYVQAMRQAEADLAVAKANQAEAESLLKIAQRELARVDKLRQRGVSSESQRDIAMADQLAKQAHVEVTRAQLIRVQAELETARIRLGYTRVKADWGSGSELRIVAERYVDEGETVSANAQLLRIVELDPMKAIFYVTERDYARLQPGQRASLTTDAYLGEYFDAEIVRISPVFQENTRQAQVELKVENFDQRLKPGLFVRVDVVLERAKSVTIVPEPALASREERDGVFVVDAEGGKVSWRPVEVGIRQSQRVEITGEGLEGRVVVLGQQLLDDGSDITITGERRVGRP
ncbi:MAG: efflux RND transporter periplasmic adaptor subunit [Candidatus Thiodiazotropha sp. 6PLUC9]